MGATLVTGGAGFIGSNYVRQRLARTDDDIVVLDKLTYAGSRENLPCGGTAPRLRFVQGDIADADLVSRVFSEHRPTIVVNFAAESHVDRSIDTPRPFIDTNIKGTFELLEASRKLWKESDETFRSQFRFLHVSTDEVFGSLGADGLFSEQTPYAPNSPYSASKAAADHLVRAYFHTYALPTLITNCSNNYGPYQFPEKLIPLIILNALDGKPLPIYGNGMNVRDWLYVEDHCSGIDTVLGKGRVGDCYNIGGASEKTNLEIVDTICAILDRLVPAAANPATPDAVESYGQLKTFVPDRKGHDWRYAIDASKIRRELGWSPRHRFDDGLEATIKWYLDNRDWCEVVQTHAEYGRERLGLEK